METIPNSKRKVITRKIVITGIIVFLGLIVITVLFFHFINPIIDFDNATVHKENNVQNKESVTCHVTYSTHGNGGIRQWFYEVNDFRILDLQTDTPKLELNGNIFSNLQKVYESANYMTLQTEPWWNVDIIGIDRLKGTFMRTMNGTNGGMQYAIAQKGWCE
jgi:hypothetical protein